LYFSDNYNECEAAEITTAAEMSSEDEPEPPEKTDRCSKRQPKKKTYEDFVSGKVLIVLIAYISHKYMYILVNKKPLCLNFDLDSWRIQSLYNPYSFID